jgi:hypothetical protein
MRFLLKRWWFWLGAFALLGLLAAGIALTLAGGSGINQANFDRIQEGMTEDEVTRIFERNGSPAADWGGAARSVPSSSLVAFRAFGILSDGSVATSYLWEDGPSSIWAVCEHEKVRSKGVHFATAWDRLRWQYGQLLKKLGL